MKKTIVILMLSFLAIFSYSQNTAIGTFKDCQMGDLLHINFDGIDVDFGSGKNNYSGYELCLENADGDVAPNPKYIGKQFLIKWRMVKTEVTTDPLEPWKTEFVERPSIISLQLINSKIEKTSLESSLEKDIINLVMCIRNNDENMFEKIKINNEVAQRYLKEYDLDKNSKLYGILSSENFLEGERNSIKYIRSFLNRKGKAHLNKNIDKMLANFAIENEKKGETVVYYTTDGNCDGFKIIRINLNKKNYFLVHGTSGCDCTMSEMRKKYNTNLRNGYKFIDLRNIKFTNNKKVVKKEQLTKNEKIDEQLLTAKTYYTKKDYENAFVWYQKAANDNNVIAQYQLGYMYRKGLGTRKSRKNAKIWWKKACKQGHKKSCKEIEKMNAFGNAFLKAVVNSMAESSNNGNSSTGRSNTGFVGRWKSDMGPNFGASSRLIITRINGGYRISLDGKSYVGKLNLKTGRIDFKGYKIEYDKSKDLLELLPSMSVYKRY